MIDEEDGSGTGGRWVVGRYLSFPQRCRSLEAGTQVLRYRQMYHRTLAVRWRHAPFFMTWKRWNKVSGLTVPGLTG
jgi:hypothetical protein